MKLKEWREEVGRSVADVAEELGCTRQAIAKYEAGGMPKPEMMAAIIELTRGDVTPNDWFDFFTLAPGTDSHGDRSYPEAPRQWVQRFHPNYLMQCEADAAARRAAASV